METTNNNENNFTTTYTITAHSSNALKVMNTLRQDDKLCDVTLKIGLVEIKAHKLVLSANSEYFQNMFCNNYKETNQSVIFINHLHPHATKAIINYFYTSILLINHENIEQLFETADYLLVTDVLRVCKNFLSSTVNYSNCLFIQKLINKFNLHDLQEEQNTFYSNLSYEQLVNVLDYSSTTPGTYYLKRQIIDKWKSHDPINRRRKFMRRAGLFQD